MENLVLVIIFVLLMLVAFVCYQNRKETIFVLLSGIPMLVLSMWIITLFLPWGIPGLTWYFIPAFFSFVVLSAGIIGAGICAFLSRVSVKRGWKYLPQIFAVGKWLVLIGAQLFVVWFLTVWI